MSESAQDKISNVALIIKQAPTEPKLESADVQAALLAAIERESQLDDPKFYADVLGPLLATKRDQTGKNYGSTITENVHVCLQKLKKKDFLPSDARTDVVVPTFVDKTLPGTASSLGSFDSENEQPSRISKLPLENLAIGLAVLLLALVYYWYPERRLLTGVIAALLFLVMGLRKSSLPLLAAAVVLFLLVLMPWGYGYFRTEQISVASENVQVRAPLVVDETLPATKKELRETATAIRSEHAIDVNRMDKWVTDVKESHNARLNKIEAVVTQHVATPHANAARRAPVRRTSPKPPAKSTGCVTVIHDLSVKGQTGTIRKPCQVIK